MNSIQNYGITNSSINFSAKYPTADILELASNRCIRWGKFGNSCQTNIRTLNSFANNKVDISETNGYFIVNLFDYAAKKIQKQLPQLKPFIERFNELSAKFKYGMSEESYFAEIEKTMKSAEKQLGK